MRAPSANWCAWKASAATSTITGTHFIDMFSFFSGERPARWVLAQIDYRTENRVFGAHCENQQVLLTEYDNGFRPGEAAPTARSRWAASTA